MPVIPTYEAKEQLDPDARGMPRPTFSTAAADAEAETGAKIQGLGSAITAGADRLQAEQERYNEIQNKRAEFNTRLALDRFGAEIEKDDLDAFNNKQPDGSGYAQGRIDNFVEKSAKFLQEKVPPQLREEYAQRIQTLQDKRHNLYAQEEAEALNKFATNQLAADLDASRTAVYKDPGALDERLKDFAERIDAAPIPSAAKEQLKTNARLALKEVAASGIAPDDWQKAADVLGVPDYTPTTGRVERAQERYNSKTGGPRAEIPAGMSGSGNAALESRLMTRESGGRPGIVNSLGFAGLFQFGAPRLQTLGLYKPGANEDMSGWNTAGKNAPGKWSGTFNIPGHPEVKTLADFLKSPDAQRVAFAAHTDEIDKQIERRGLDEYIGKKVGGVTITRDGIVAMAHLGGIGGAEKALKSGGRSNAQDANKTGVLSYAAMFQDTGGNDAPAAQAIQVATRGDTASDAPPAYAATTAVDPNGAPSSSAPELTGPDKIETPAAPPRVRYAADPRFAELPLETKLKIIRQAEVGQAQKLQLETQRAVQDAALAEKERSHWVDMQQFEASKGRVTREKVEADFLAGKYKSFEEMNGVIAQIKKADNENANLNAFNQALATPNFVWNPLDKAHRDMVEAGFEARGNDISGLQSVVQQTHIVPQSAVVSLRGAIVSNDATRAERALTVASNLQRFNPNIFAGTQGAEDIQNNAVTFRHYVNDLGMSPAEATRQVLKEQTPEYQTQIKTKVKSLNVDEIVKKNLNEGDLRSTFNDGWPLISRPDVGGSDLAVKRAAMSDYEELFRERYVETGDVGTAKAQAMEQMKKVWGVTRVSGNPVLLRYPPEKAPAYRGVPDAADQIAAQAMTTIKAATGADIPRKQIIVAPLPDGSTATPYKMGERPSFLLAWTDKNGVLHQAQTPFTPDPHALAVSPDVSAQRQTQFMQQRGQIDFSRSQEGRGFADQARRAIDASSIGQGASDGR